MPLSSRETIINPRISSASNYFDTLRSMNTPILTATADHTEGQLLAGQDAELYEAIRRLPVTVNEAATIELADLTAQVAEHYSLAPEDMDIALKALRIKAKTRHKLRHQKALVN